MISSVYFVTFLCSLSLVHGLPTTTAKNNYVIGYPEVEGNERLKNKNGRRPIYAPSMCRVNELFYPGDQASDWICECRPGYLYDPDTNKCWPAWQQGPCSKGQYLTLNSTSAIPVCRKNPCARDAFVPFNEKCKRLGSTEACDGLFPYVTVLGVNATTLSVECIRLLLDTDTSSERIPSDAASEGSRPDLSTQSAPPNPTVAYSFLKPCRTGTRRQKNGRCEDDS